MTPFLALEQAFNFLLPAWGLALIMALASKWFLRAALKGAGVGRLWWRLGVVNTVASVAALAATLHDGSMVQYALLILGSALTVWWTSRR